MSNFSFKPDQPEFTSLVEEIHRGDPRGQLVSRSYRFGRRSASPGGWPWLLALALAACGAPRAAATVAPIDNRRGPDVTPVAPGPAAIDWAAVASMPPD